MATILLKSGPGMRAVYAWSGVRCANLHPVLCCRFIKWTQETFRSGGHQAELLPLLERCTRELQGYEHYKNDVRYLRVWVQYVSGHWQGPVIQVTIGVLLPVLLDCRLTHYLNPGMFSSF